MSGAHTLEDGNAERAARRAEGIINLAFETTLGAGIGGGTGIVVGLLVPALVAAAPLFGTIGGVALGVLVGRRLLSGSGHAPA